MRLSEKLECLACGKKLDSATHPTDPKAVPSPGDITICLYCGEVMAFNEDVTAFRPLTDKEVIELAGSSELKQGIRVATKFQKWKEEKENERG